MSRIAVYPSGVVTSVSPVKQRINAVPSVPIVDQMPPEPLLVVVDVLPVPMRPEYIVLYISLAGFARAAA